MIWDLPAARARFGKHLSVAINGGMPPVADVLRLWPAKRVEMDEGTVHQGLGIRLKLRRTDATAEMDLGDEARFWPSDEALARWRSLAEGGAAMIVYE
jgi:DNA polymerase-3 subunit alpha